MRRARCDGGAENDGEAKNDDEARTMKEHNGRAAQKAQGSRALKKSKLEGGVESMHAVHAAQP